MSHVPYPLKALVVMLASGGAVTFVVFGVVYLVNRVMTFLRGGREALKRDRF